MVLYNGGRAGGGVMQSDVYDGYAPEMGHGDSSWGVFIWGWGAAVSGGVLSSIFCASWPWIGGGRGFISRWAIAIILVVELLLLLAMSL